MTTPTGPVGVGIIGAGVISKTYLQNLTSFPDVEVLAIGDIVESAAQSRAEEFGIANHGGIDAVRRGPLEDAPIGDGGCGRVRGGFHGERRTFGQERLSERHTERRWRERHTEGVGGLVFI